MRDRIITRDLRRRLLTLRDAQLPRTSPPIIAVLSYVGDSRVPASIRVHGTKTLVRNADGGYASTGPGGITRVTDLSLNQRTGRLDYLDSVSGFTVDDIWRGRTGNEEGYRAVVIFALLFLPPAWPLLVIYLLEVACEGIRKRLRTRIDAILDFVSGAYRV